MNSEQWHKNDYEKHRPILAIDYGKKYVGTAILIEQTGDFPMPFERIDNKNRSQLTSDLYKVLTREKIKLVVIGIPHLLDGQETEMGKIIRRFILDLKTKCDLLGLIFTTQDETLSSFEAENRMKSSALYNFRVDKEKIDCLAAAIILEDFIRLSSIKLTN